MKLYIRATTGLDFDSPKALADAIEDLLNSEGIGVEYVGYDDDDWDDDVRHIYAVTFGDWRNDNDRADYLVETNFHPDKSDSYERDPADYGHDSYAGTDNCVSMHHWIWYLK